jgi:hypothetical protein
MQEPIIDDFRDPDRLASFPLAMWLGRVIDYQRAFDEQRVRHGRIHALSKDQVWIEDLQPRMGRDKPWVEAYSTDVVVEVKPTGLSIDMGHTKEGQIVHPVEALFHHTPFYRMIDTPVMTPDGMGKVRGLYCRGLEVLVDGLLAERRYPWDELELVPGQ